jgi:uncharacterized protein YkwD
MIELLLAGVAVWLLAVLFILSICRAAARSDENDAGRRRRDDVRRRATVSLAAAAVVFPALPQDAEAACANRNVQFAENPAVVRDAMLCEIDRVRNRHDAGRLRTQDQLDVAAERHAADMLERRYFSHVSPGGGELGDRVRRAGYARRTCSWRVGEVLAWGVGSRSTAWRTVQAWLDSPSHRRILLADRYSQIGLGLQAGAPVDGYTGGLTAAAVLGRRDCSP